MKPLYLLAGSPGSRKKGGDRILKRVLLSAGKPHPSIAYIGAASGDNRLFFGMFRDALREVGAGDVRLCPLASVKADVGKSLAVMESSDMIFISGGDVEKGMKTLEKRKILPFLQRLYEDGKTFFGISAGSILLGRQWIRWEDPEDDDSAVLFPCMGFAPIILDTHDEEDGWGELKFLLSLTPAGTVGYGIPSGAGLCVHPNGVLEPLGGKIALYERKRKEVIPLPGLE